MAFSMAPWCTIASFIVPLVCYGFLYGTLMYHGLPYDTMVSGGLSIFSWAPKLGRSCYMTLDCQVYICKQVLEGNLCYQQQPHILGSGDIGVCQGPLAAPDGGHFGITPPMWVWTPLTVWVWTPLVWMWWCDIYDAYVC